jgi:hypothetical protein
VVPEGQFRILTVPPVTTAAARKGPVEGRDGAGGDPPVVRDGVVDRNAEGAQCLDRHADVIEARHGLADVFEVQSLVEARTDEQQRGDEL